jgi:hypothetical protein
VGDREDAFTIVANNVFHRAVAFGTFRSIA